MGIRKIMTVKEPCLHKVCRPVEKFDGKLHKLLDDMKETLLDANGVALRWAFCAGWLLWIPVRKCWSW